MGHTYSSLFYHVVFSTKNRDALITDDLRERLYDYMGGVVRSEFGESVRIGGMPDHVHGLLIIKPSVSISDAMAKWKSHRPGYPAGTTEKHHELRAGFRRGALSTEPGWRDLQNRGRICAIAIL